MKRSNLLGRNIVITFLSCLAVLAVFFAISRTRNLDGTMPTVTVGFIYESDESAPYTYNCARAEVMLHEELRDDVTIIRRNNVPEDGIEEPLRELADEGCDIIFTNCHTPEVAELASSFPDVEICQISDLEEAPASYPENYHTYNGEIYQARYVCGVAAGLKLREMIGKGEITPEEAVIGYVGAFPVAPVISGYTAFLIGVRSVVPEAVMKVKYTGTWGSFSKEKECAAELIKEGCTVITQHSDTSGPAIACEEAAVRRPMVYIGVNKSMLDVAPATALMSLRIDWSPYVMGAVEAVRSHQKIESVVDGRANGNDISRGFDEGWLELMDLNMNIAAKGTEAAVKEAITAICGNRTIAFRGDYTGADPDNPSDTYDLSKGYIENAASSIATFHYVLKDVITVLT